ncbi:MAG: hypothetical protein IKP32_08610 [Clostridia bacterium]|nr:hypothetical protein [Clostridia bacterium]
MTTHQKPENSGSEKGLSMLDRWMALHQRAFWLVIAAVAVAGAALIVRWAPAAYGTYLGAGLAMGLMVAYRRCAGAPVRMLRQATARLRTPPDRVKDGQALDDLNALHAHLPSLRKKELAYSITCCQAMLLARLGRRDEALALLRGFDQTWDESQRQDIRILIQKISGEGAPSPEKEQA